MEIKAATSSAGVPKNCRGDQRRDPRGAIRRRWDAIVEAVRSVLERTPPDWPPDIGRPRHRAHRGRARSCATLDVFAARETGLRSWFADSPECAVVLGTGRAPTSGLLKEVALQ